MTAALEIPQKLADDVVAIRRDLHMHPELGFEERRTAAIVADRLSSSGFEVHAGIAGTGVIGVMRGSARGRTIALRADMDALTIAEENAHEY
ncbi:MAG: amidohydrolase, partial [Rhodanobacteraceae bacterium]